MATCFGAATPEAARATRQFGDTGATIDAPGKLTATGWAEFATGWQQVGSRLATGRQQVGNRLASKLGHSGLEAGKGLATGGRLAADWQQV